MYTAYTDAHADALHTHARCAAAVHPHAHSTEGVRTHANCAYAVHTHEHGASAECTHTFALLQTQTRLYPHTHSSSYTPKTYIHKQTFTVFRFWQISAMK
eukprot:GHVS01083776.1.p2 GENE.GHVS01083776.1~~GHVS01083776.1.p2  ORF type:complete len:100 (-),score=6.19 GHVS01083776.1:232-531(-)